MPRRRTETDEQHMDRLRAARGLPPMREDPMIMDRTRAAAAYIGTAHSEDHRQRLALHAFMAIFHPEEPAERVRALVRAQKSR